MVGDLDDTMRAACDGEPHRPMPLVPDHATLDGRPLDAVAVADLSFAGGVDSGPAALARSESLRRRLTLVAILTMYVVAASLLAWVRLPQRDEGQVLGAAYELAHHGRLAMPMWRAWFPSLEHHLYVTMPLHYIQLAPWSELFGFSVRALRANTIAWGLVLVTSWYVVVNVLTGSWRTAVLALVLLTLNYDIVNLTSARYDPMCAALGAAGIAVYLTQRERSLVRAVLLANTCLAAGLLTHPFGITAVVLFVLLFGVLDIRRLSLRLIGAAALPYVVGFGAWGAYILQDPVAFRAQLLLNARPRAFDWAHPLRGVTAEIHERYVVNYAGWRPDVPKVMRVKLGILGLYLIGVCGCLALRELRRDRRVQALVAASGVAALILMVADARVHGYVYLIYVLPVLTVCLALTLSQVATWGRAGRWLVAATVFGWVAFSAATLAYRVRLDDYDALYLPTLAYLQAHVQPGELVVAGGEFGPGLNFGEHVSEDAKLGFETGQRPDWIVFDKSQADWLETYVRSEPAVADYARRLLTTYRVAFERHQPYNYYVVYRRTAGLDSQRGAGRPN